MVSLSNVSISSSSLISSVFLHYLSAAGGRHVSLPFCDIFTVHGWDNDMRHLHLCSMTLTSCLALKKKLWSGPVSIRVGLVFTIIQLTDLWLKGAHACAVVYSATGTDDGDGLPVVLLA